jgi:hypothetical protein
VEAMTKRVDELVAKVREIHRLYLEEGVGRRDVLICSHGEHRVCASCFAR